MTDMTGSRVEAAIATAVDGDYESRPGLTPDCPSSLAHADVYAARVGVNHASFPVSLIAHANAEATPNAMYRKAITLEM